MKLQEILDTQVDWEETNDDVYLWSAKAKIGKREIEFNAMAIDDTDDYKIEFNEKRRGKERTIDATGSGNELAVFSMVKDCMHAFVANRQREHGFKPERIIFTADKTAGESRTRLYSSLLKKAIKLPGYTLTKHVGGNEDEFVLTLND